MVGHTLSIFTPLPSLHSLSETNNQGPILPVPDTMWSYLTPSVLGGYLMPGSLGFSEG